MLYLLNINPKQIKAKDNFYELNKQRGVIPLGMGQFCQWGVVYTLQVPIQVQFSFRFS